VASALTGGQNTIVGMEAGTSLTTGYRNTIIGHKANSSYHDVYNSTAIGYDADVFESNSVVIGRLVDRIGIGKNALNGEIMSFSATLAHLTTGGVWTNASDRNIKENFRNLDGSHILSQLHQMPITEWNYINEPDSIRHIGPMAQDFYAAFGLGGNDKTISTIDPSGVALVAIQALYQKQLELEESHKELKTLKQEFASQQSQIESMSSALAELQRLIQPGTITDFTD
jgi:hypothetical protein